MQSQDIYTYLNEFSTASVYWSVAHVYNVCRNKNVFSRGISPPLKTCRNYYSAFLTAKEAGVCTPLLSDTTLQDKKMNTCWNKIDVSRTLGKPESVNFISWFLLKKCHLSLPRIKPQFLGCLIFSLISVPTVLSWLQCGKAEWLKLMYDMMWCDIY